MELKEYNENYKRILGDDSYFLAYDNRSMENGDSRDGEIFKSNQFTGKAIKVSGSGKLDNGLLIKRTFGWPRYL